MRAAASGSRKVSPRKAKLWPSSFLHALLHGVICWSEGGILCTSTMWSSLGTVMMVRRTAREDTGISTIGGGFLRGKLPPESQQA